MRPVEPGVTRPSHLPYTQTWGATGKSRRPRVPVRLQPHPRPRPVSDLTPHHRADSLPRPLRAPLRPPLPGENIHLGSAAFVSKTKNRKPRSMQKGSLFPSSSLLSPFSRTFPAPTTPAPPFNHLHISHVRHSPNLPRSPPRTSLPPSWSYPASPPRPSLLDSFRPRPCEIEPSRSSSSASRGDASGFGG